ncbi:membrane protein insertase YidC [Roseococcus thiosulfatophilus]|uniref:membrane protein insertase YidC n=1 Tax=Roseococcus thiosulfatophilus TaxID=35813 RepID=UPI001A8C670C|nr:membrane protein insertase YidC [Roseococcus thiosulfatophilus]
MDQKRLLAAIALSVGILLLFEMWNRGNAPVPPPRPVATQQADVPLPAVPAPATPQVAPGAAPGAPQAAGPGETAVTAAPPAIPAQRVQVENTRVQGALTARGLSLDQLTLRDYRETVEPNSPNVTLLAPRGRPEGYFAQWGWTQADGRTPVPNNDTDWTVTGGPLGPNSPVTFRWDNGQGQIFQAVVSLDANYMFEVRQSVENTSAEAVTVLPWARIRRERTPQVQGFFILHEGFIAVQDGRLTEMTYSTGRDEGNSRRALGSAWENEAAEGWAGLSDKYWLTALTRLDRNERIRSAFRHIPDAGVDRWQVDIAPAAPQLIAPGQSAGFGSRLFAGAKEVRLLDDYRDRLHIQDFDKAIDFGWFYFITKPFFYALDYLFILTGNFGVAILIFTLALKILFFPLANKAYKSMSRMRLVAPKMQEIRERYKDDPQKMQAEMMALYKSEKINPASGCLPILVQIPVFFALYKVLFVTIEMRHAPFFGWIRDLSDMDPTNAFTLFGLIPWDPPLFLHLPIWAILMGLTMFIQQKLNPQPPDPIQQKIFAWLPVIFTFMLASFPAGLVIYWTWNNLLSIAQQWYIMRLDAKAQAAKPPAQGGTGGAPPAPKGGGKLAGPAAAKK